MKPTVAKTSRGRTPDFGGRVWAGLLALLLAWFTWLMLRITLQYWQWPLRPDAAFLQIKQDYVGLPWWRAAFYVHVFTSLFALAAGFTQFSPRVLGR